MPGCTRRTGGTPPKVQASSWRSGRYRITSMRRGSFLEEHALGLQDALGGAGFEHDEVDDGDPQPNRWERARVRQWLRQRADEVERRDAGARAERRDERQR